MGVVKLLVNIVRYSLALLGVFFVVIGIWWGYQAITSEPSMPVAVKIRNSVVGNGDVLVFESKVNHDLFLDISLQNKEMTDKKLFKINLKPNISKSIGWLEGWPVRRSDLLRIESSGYAATSYHLKNK